MLVDYSRFDLNDLNDFDYIYRGVAPSRVYNQIIFRHLTSEQLVVQRRTEREVRERVRQQAMANQRIEQERARQRALEEEQERARQRALEEEQERARQRALEEERARQRAIAAQRFEEELYIRAKQQAIAARVREEAARARDAQVRQLRQQHQEAVRRVERLRMEKRREEAIAALASHRQANYNPGTTQRQRYQEAGRRVERLRAEKQQKGRESTTEIEMAPIEQAHWPCSVLEEDEYQPGAPRETHC